MAKQRSYAAILGDLQRFHARLASSVAELQHLEAPHKQLGERLARAQELLKQQSTLAAAKQEATQELKTLLLESDRQANAMRGMVKSHFGIRAEKLTEFGLQPFRGRTRKAKAATPTPDAPEEQEKPTPPPVTPTTT